MPFRVCLQAIALQSPASPDHAVRAPLEARTNLVSESRVSSHENQQDEPTEGFAFRNSLLATRNGIFAPQEALLQRAPSAKPATSPCGSGGSTAISGSARIAVGRPLPQRFSAAGANRLQAYPKGHRELPQSLRLQAASCQLNYSWVRAAERILAVISTVGITFS